MRNLISKITFAAYRSLPPNVRYQLKRLANTNGHAASPFDKLKGMRDADGKKRLDRAFAAVLFLLDEAHISNLEGKRCLEVGAGFVPSDTLCFYLLGARESIATDYNRIQQYDALLHAVQSADFGKLEALATPVVGREIFLERVHKLQKACEGGEKALLDLGISYQAPMDLTAERLNGEFDLIYSVSVFEHIPQSMIGPILKNLATALTPTGCMLHDIHLEDHYDVASDPFGFLRQDNSYSMEEDADGRGNRIRFGEWKEIFSSLDHSNTDVLIRSIRSDHLPEKSELLPEFFVLDPDDCFTGRIVTKTLRVS